MRGQKLLSLSDIVSECCVFNDDGSFTVVESTQHARSLSTGLDLENRGQLQTLQSYTSMLYYVTMKGATPQQESYQEAVRIEIDRIKFKKNSALVVQVISADNEIKASQN